MEDVTDTVFRELILNISDPSVLKVLFTEFTSTDGLMDHRGFERVSERLVTNQTEIALIKQTNAKLVAQIWGNDPEKFRQSAELITRMGVFDGVDINMGCPVKKVVKKSTCSALIKMPELAKEIVQATMEGTNLPVSVKTRIGFNEVVTEKWVSHLLEVKPAAITIHGRTQKMQSDGLADWNEVRKAVDLRNAICPETIMLGNGDVLSYADGIEKAKSTGVEGIMVGRGVFQNPWMFNASTTVIPLEERLRVLEQHVRHYEKTWGGTKNVNTLKRFFKIYANSFPGAADFRAKLMETRGYKDIYQVVDEFSKVGV